MNNQQEREVMSGYHLYCERETFDGREVTVELLPARPDVTDESGDVVDVGHPPLIGLMLRDRQVMMTAAEAKDIATALAAASYDLDWRYEPDDEPDIEDDSEWTDEDERANPLMGELRRAELWGGTD